MQENKTTFLLLPGGEWLTTTTTALGQAGIETRQQPNSLTLSLPKFNIQGLVARSNDVPRLVDSPESRAQAGLTGTDILVRQQKRSLIDVQNSDALPDWKMPLGPLVKNIPKSKVYLGATPNARQQFGDEPTLSELAQGTTVSAYTSIAQEYYEQQGLTPNIERFDGKIEGLWNVLGGCFAVCDIEVSGKTRRANEITIVDIIMSAWLVLYENQEKMSPIDQQRLLDLKTALTEAATTLASGKKIARRGFFSLPGFLKR